MTTPNTGGNTGRNLGLALGPLWECANVHLPGVAERYIDWAGRVSGTAGGDNAFMRPTGDSSGYGAIYPPWAEMRDMLQALLVRSAEHVYGASDAINRAVTVFTDTDATHAGAIDAAGAKAGLDEYLEANPQRPEDVVDPSERSPIPQPSTTDLDDNPGYQAEK